MWTLRKAYRFEAAHRLPHHNGKCSRLHGHSWELIVELRGDALQSLGPKQGMITDFGDISTEVKPLLDHYLDHHFLNDSLTMENPTSEAIAEWIYAQLKPRFSRLLRAVEISETCTSWTRYEPKAIRY